MIPFLGRFIPHATYADYGDAQVVTVDNLFDVNYN